ncbi:MAG TPA: molybdopterin-dependent oxidoreductase, partial [Chloroflexota bacterium]|nr:molybdopterin-dependent oxidoreductase [Chloroflexota bacterium]
MRGAPQTAREGVPPAIGPGGPNPVPIALDAVGRMLRGATGIIGIGSPRASLESNYALRALVGPDSFCTGMSDVDHRLVATILEILRRGPVPSASLKDARESDAVLVLGEDVTNTAPMLALSLRQSVRNRPMKRVAKLKIPEWHDDAVREAMGGEKGPFFLATVSETRLEEVATRSYHAAPEDIARLGFAVAGALQGERVSGEVDDLARAIAEALKGAERPLIVAGTSLGSDAVLHAAANVAFALQAAGSPVRLSFVVPECNSMGLGLMGGMSLGDAFRAMGEGRADTVVVLENDLYRRAGATEVDAFFQTARNVVVLEQSANETTAGADIVLPAAAYGEADGSYVSQEGRAQRFYQLFVPRGYMQESWRWIGEMAVAAGRAEVGSWDSLDAVTTAMAAEIPALARVPEVAPSSEFRIAGQKIARQHTRFSGRTAMTANIDVSEPKPPDDPDTPFAFSMEGYQGMPPSPLIPRIWAPGWNSEQALNKFQEEVPGPLKGGNPGIRLIEPTAGGGIAPFKGMPEPFRARPGEWLVVPLFHIFGSEELSAMAPGIAELTPRAYLGLNPQEAGRLGLAEGEEVDIELGGRPRRLVVKGIPTLPVGVAGVPVGFTGLEGIVLPAWARWAGR